MSTEVGSQKKTKSCQHSLRMTPKGNKENVPFDSSIVYTHLRSILVTLISFTDTRPFQNKPYRQKSMDDSHRCTETEEQVWMSR
jgi:hypothetical protein